MLRAIVIAGLVMFALAAHAQGPPPQTPSTTDPPLEFTNPDELLDQFQELIENKRMDELFKVLVRTANLTHPLKNIDPDALRRIGHNMLGLFLVTEQVHYVDRVRDQSFGTALREVVFLAYTSRDRWIYFTVIMKRGAVGWQVTKFDYAIDRFDLFPAAPAQ